MISITEGNNLGDLLKYEVSNLYSRELEPFRFFYDTVQPILLRRELLSLAQILYLSQMPEFFPSPSNA